MEFFKRLQRRAAIDHSRQSLAAFEAILSEMGAELHDDLIQKLSLLRLHLDKIERSSFDPKETQATVIRMQADFQHVVDSVRRIARRLQPVHMEGDDFQRRVEILCQTLDMPGTVRISQAFTGTPQALEPTTETYLLRIIQELIHNSFKHSAAWHVWIRVDWKKTELVVQVEDDGSGFSKIQEFIERLDKKHNTIRMRADAIGASVKYRSGEKGLLATIRLPLPPKEARS